ncbi:sulfur carrier protein ThiS [Cryobacterium tagatosivorans]|uniref:Sulfur carrier protein ThiS n=1 Tax=Cryobacterium tagatosivorans TaxID=1259199 RepID=A0A4V6QG43_9MICO|nr:sulfur carrier protein ThiS [Cryobacterium tagatosivorans]
MTVNGSARALNLGETVTDLVREATGRRIGDDGRATDGKRLGVAVARNAGIVPRSQWAATALAPGDGIEIVTAVQGG